MKLEEKRAKAFSEFWRITKVSWTYERLTEDEKQELVYAIDFALKESKGEWLDIYKQLHASYVAFIYALGYRKQISDWRKPIDKHIEIYECGKETTRVL